MSASVRVLPTLEILAAQAAVYVGGVIRETCARRGRCRIALAGGSTPAPVYRLLAEEPLAWEQVELFLGDERCVPPDDPASNARMVRETLLENLPQPGPRFHDLPRAAEEPEEAARAYSALLAEPLDLVLLGIGQDGHTASLFPDSPALGEERAAVVTTGPKPPNPRITLTPSVLLGAGVRVVLAAGADKARPVARALDPRTDPHAIPAAFARDGMWFLDREAASALEAPR